MSDTQPRYFFNFSFFKIDPKWRWMADLAKEESAKELDRLSKDIIDPINNMLQKKSVNEKFTPVTQEKILERLQDILEGKVNKKFIGPMPVSNKDILLNAKKGEQALAKIRISKGHQQLLSKVPDIENQINKNKLWQKN